jgi:hypothetical protein
MYLSPFLLNAIRATHVLKKRVVSQARADLNCWCFGPDFHFIHEFVEQDVAEPLHIYVSDKNEVDFQYVKDVLKKSGFSCGEVDWYASNQPVNPVIFEEAESSCQELSMVNNDPHSIVRHMLLFDVINEVLLEIYDSSLVIGPWHSRFDSRTRPVPMGSHVLQEVWAKVSC